MSARAFFEACGSTSSQIFRLLPEFAGRELQNNSEDGAVDPKVSSFEVQTVSQLQIFEAVAQFFYRFSLRSPLFLILDDMQWCDKTSVELFRHIQRGDFKGRRIAIVCTCRDSYLEAENPNLFTLISEMPISDKISNVIKLERFDLGKTMSLVRSYQGTGEATDSQCELLYKKSGGNPLFVRELLALVEERPDTVPAQVKQWSSASLREIIFRTPWKKS